MCLQCSLKCRSKLLAVKQTLALSPYVLWLDADALFARFDVPVSLAREQRLLSEKEYGYQSG